MMENEPVRLTSSSLVSSSFNLILALATNRSGLIRQNGNSEKSRPAKGKKKKKILW